MAQNQRPWLREFEGLDPTPPKPKTKDAKPAKRKPAELAPPTKLKKDPDEWKNRGLVRTQPPRSTLRGEFGAPRKPFSEKAGAPKPQKIPARYLPQPAEPEEDNWQDYVLPGVQYGDVWRPKERNPLPAAVPLPSPSLDESDIQGSAYNMWLHQGTDADDPEDTKLLNSVFDLMTARPEQMDVKVSPDGKSSTPNILKITTNLLSQWALGWASVEFSKLPERAVWASSRIGAEFLDDVPTTLTPSDWIGQEAGGAGLFQEMIGNAISQDAATPEERATAVDAYKQYWNEGKIGWSLIFTDDEHMSNFIRDIEAGMDVDESIEKYEKFWPEFIGGIVFDPDWVVGAGLISKLLFPAQIVVQPILQVGGKLLRKIPIAKWLTSISQTSRIRLEVSHVNHAVNEAIMARNLTEGVNSAGTLMNDLDDLMRGYRSDILNHVSPKSQQALESLQVAMRSQGVASFNDLMSRYNPSFLELRGSANWEAMLQENPQWLTHYIGDATYKHVYERVTGKKPSQHPVRQALQFFRRLQKELLLGPNPAYMVGNLTDNSSKGILSGYIMNPLETNPLQRVAKHVGGWGGIVMDTVDRGFVNIEIGKSIVPNWSYVPIPGIGKPPEIVDTLEFLLQTNVREKLPDFLQNIVQPRNVPELEAAGLVEPMGWVGKALDTINFASIIKKGGDISNGIERGARLQIYDQAFTHYMAKWGAPTVVEVAKMAGVPDSIVETMSKKLSKGMSFAEVLGYMRNFSDIIPESAVSDFLPADASQYMHNAMEVFDKWQVGAYGADDVFGTLDLMFETMDSFVDLSLRRADDIATKGGAEAAISDFKATTLRSIIGDVQRMSRWARDELNNKVRQDIAANPEKIGFLWSRYFEQSRVISMMTFDEVQRMIRETDPVLAQGIQDLYADMDITYAGRVVPADFLPEEWGLFGERLLARRELLDQNFDDLLSTLVREPTQDNLDIVRGTFEEIQTYAATAAAKAAEIRFGYKQKIVAGTITDVQRAAYKRRMDDMWRQQYFQKAWDLLAQTADDIGFKGWYAPEEFVDLSGFKGADDYISSRAGRVVDPTDPEYSKWYGDYLVRKTLGEIRTPAQRVDFQKYDIDGFAARVKFFEDTTFDTIADYKKATGLDVAFNQEQASRLMRPYKSQHVRLWLDVDNPEFFNTVRNATKSSDIDKADWGAISDLINISTLYDEVPANRTGIVVEVPRNQVTQFQDGYVLDKRADWHEAGVALGVLWDYDIPTPAIRGMFDGYTVVTERTAPWSYGRLTSTGIPADIKDLSLDVARKMTSDGDLDPAMYTRLFMHNQVKAGLDSDISMSLTKAHQLTAEGRKLADDVLEWYNGVKKNEGKLRQAVVRTGEETKSWNQSIATVAETLTKEVKTAQLYGAKEVNDKLFDYSMQGNWEEILGAFYPFTTWQTRNPLMWYQMTRNRPAIWTTLVRSMALMKSQRDRNNLTVRFNGTVPVPFQDQMIESGFAQDGYYATDLTSIFSIMSQGQELFISPAEDDATGARKLASRLARTGEYLGMTPYPGIQAAGRYVARQLDIPVSNNPPYGLTGPVGRVWPWLYRKEIEWGEVRVPGSSWLREYKIRRELAFMTQMGEVDPEEAFIAEGGNNQQLLESINDEIIQQSWLFSAIRLAIPFSIKYASTGELELRADRAKMKDMTPEQQAFFRTSHPAQGVYSRAIASVENPEWAEWMARRDAIFVRYAQMTSSLPPWHPRKTELNQAMWAEIDGLGDPPEKIGETGYAIDPTSRTAVLYALEEMRPKAEDFEDTNGNISWEEYYDMEQEYLRAVPGLADELGQAISEQEYINFRERYMSPEEIAWRERKRDFATGWDRYHELKGEQVPEEGWIPRPTNYYEPEQGMELPMNELAPDLQAWVESEWKTREAAGWLPEEFAAWVSGKGIPYDVIEGMLTDEGYGEQTLQSMYGYVSKQRPWLETLPWTDPQFGNFMEMRQEVMPGMFGTDDEVEQFIGDYYARMPGQRTQIRRTLGVDLAPGETFAEYTRNNPELANVFYSLPQDVQYNILRFTPPTETEQMLAELERTRWELGTGEWTPLVEKYYGDPESPRSKFWDLINSMILDSSAYDNPVLGPLLNRDTRDALDPTDDQYTKAIEYAQLNEVFLVNKEATQKAEEHPDWWATAQEQKQEYKLNHPYTREEEMYYALETPKEQDEWRDANPEVWASFQATREAKTRAQIENPYYLYFFNPDKYEQWFGDTTPDQVDVEVEVESYNQAVHDSIRQEEVGGSWTADMDRWFGSRGSASGKFWDYYFANKAFLAGYQENPVIMAALSSDVRSLIPSDAMIPVFEEALNRIKRYYDSEKSHRWAAYAGLRSQADREKEHFKELFPWQEEDPGVEFWSRRKNWILNHPAMAWFHYYDYYVKEWGGTPPDQAVPVGELQWNSGGGGGGGGGGEPPPPDKPLDEGVPGVEPPGSLDPDDFPDLGPPGSGVIDRWSGIV